MASALQSALALVTPQNALFIVLLGILYAVVLGVYRLIFSPLAVIPGPKLAALTAWYSTYYDVVLGGKYIWQIRDMHEKYGPIVRVRPDTIHILDPAALDLIYGTGSASSRAKRLKSDMGCNLFMSPGCFISTPSHARHRALRAPLDPFFSPRSIRRVEPLLQESLRKILQRLDKHAQSGAPLQLKLLFAAAASDVITDYAFDCNWRSLDAEDLNAELFTFMASMPEGCHVCGHFPGPMMLIQRLPIWAMGPIWPGLKVAMPFFGKVEARVRDISSEEKLRRSATKVNIQADESDYNVKTAFEALINSSLPSSDKGHGRLFREAMLIFGAGSGTTSWGLAAAMFELLSMPEAAQKLRKELLEAFPDPQQELSLLEVERLPYLSAIVQEVLRLHSPAAMRQERVAPDEDLVYTTADGKTYAIPRGTNMSTTAPLLNRLESLYPSPDAFRPERYLETPGLDKYSMTFGRGSRSCIGVNLARAELHLFIAGIFRHYAAFTSDLASADEADNKGKPPTLRLFQTTREDVEMASDFQEPRPKPGSSGVMVIVER